MNGSIGLTDADVQSDFFESDRQVDFANELLIFAKCLAVDSDASPAFIKEFVVFFFYEAYHDA